MNSDKNLLPDLSLTNTESQALQKIKVIVTTQFPVERMALFGSVVRGEADEESDIDLLVVTRQPLNRRERHQITDIVCEINLDYGTNFSTLVVDGDAWDHGPISLLSIHEEVQREGVLIWHSKKLLPDTFGTFEEMAEFWDTHDVTDYEEYLTPVEVKFLQKGKLYVRNYQSNL
ncbi:MAG: hypothetical protein HC875_11025 [Anaerolineales bacterium]|nr:hypothetical protein [Anaerolineales bacterium]